FITIYTRGGIGEHTGPSAAAGGGARGPALRPEPRAPARPAPSGSPATLVPLPSLRRRSRETSVSSGATSTDTPDPGSPQDTPVSPQAQESFPDACLGGRQHGAPAARARNPRVVLGSVRTGSAPRPVQPDRLLPPRCRAETSSPREPGTADCSLRFPAVNRLTQPHPATRASRSVPVHEQAHRFRESFGVGCLTPLGAPFSGEPLWTESSRSL
uniref:Uncharacterized protein n=1 Tax=Mustela putorius furo TaxID=9669 RepID=M3YHU0_MUSPF